MEFFHHPKIMTVVGILSLPLYYSLAKLIWGERFETLGETIRFLLIPDLYSLIRGRFWDDWYASIKFSFFWFLCVGWAAAVTELLARHVL